MHSYRNSLTKSSLGRVVRLREPLAGYYRRFIADFSMIAVPLTQLTKKGVAYDWGDSQQRAFDELRRRLCEAPVLVLPEGLDDFVVYCDASITRLGAVLM